MALESFKSSTQEHREIAREAVRKSLILLKNGKDSKEPFLPKRVLVAGTHADDLGFQCGGWSKTWQGMSGRITIGTTVLDAVKAIVGTETEVVYEKSPSEDFVWQGFFLRHCCRWGSSVCRVQS